MSVSFQGNYMYVNERETGRKVSIKDKKTGKIGEFKYLGSPIQRNAQSTIEMKRVQKGWSEWRQVSGVMCERRTTAGVEGTV